MIDKMSKNTSITDFTPGSIARALLEIINEEFEEYYSTLDRYTALTFVSQSTGYHLDLIGQMLDCVRQSGESDDNYRYRITQQVYVGAGANETSIRLKCLAIEGVKNVYIRPHTYGLGSFSVYVTSDNIFESDSILLEVQRVLDMEKACGIKAVAQAPIPLYVDLTIKLYFNPSITVIEGNGYLYESRSAIRNYLDNLPMGEAISTSKIVDVAMGVSNKIIHSGIVDFKINDRITLVNIYTPNWDEKIIPRNITVN
jgi:uncharacterized phage protein gp47/JayE